MEKKYISIVLATYNGERYLCEQLDSLYNQTLLADEVLVIDDCSTDGTLLIIEDYHNRYGLTYIQNEQNLGVNATFEKALNLCKGDYICFCDQDDVWFQEKNEVLYNKMQEIENEGPCIVSSRNTFVDKNLNVKYSTTLKSDTFDYHDTILYHLSQGSSMMMNRKCLDYIFPFPTRDLNICYDFHVGYIIAMTGKKYDLKQSLMYYRVHENNLTARMERKTRRNIKLNKKRPTNVVDEHYINTFIFANNQKSELFHVEKMEFVNKVISLSNNYNIIKHSILLLKTTHIPVKWKLQSFKRAIANFILAK